MGHTVTAKLNKDARRFDNSAGSTFFVSLGEKNYNFSTKENEWTNYDAALFAKDGQIDFYEQNLVNGAVISVTGSGIILKLPDNPDYKPTLQLQDAKLTGLWNDNQGQQAKPSSPAPSGQQPQGQQPQGFDEDIPF